MTVQSGQRSGAPPVASRHAVVITFNFCILGYMIGRFWSSLFHDHSLTWPDLLLVFLLLLSGADGFTRLKSLELGKDGVKAELEQKVDEVRKAVENQSSELQEQTSILKQLQFIIQTTIPMFEQVHLRTLQDPPVAGASFDVHPVSKAELRDLRNRGLIEGNNISSLEDGTRINLHDHFKITDLGQNYLRLLVEMSQPVDGPATNSG